jgi:hypothetical protein
MSGKMWGHHVFIGNLLLDDRVALSALSINLDPPSMRRKGISWSGSFIVPRKAEMPSMGLPYRLIFDDGRSGEIHIDSAPACPHQATTVYFTGVGNLQ